MRAPDSIQSVVCTVKSQVATSIASPSTTKSTRILLATFLVLFFFLLFSLSILSVVSHVLTRRAAVHVIKFTGDKKGGVLVRE